MVIHKRIQKLFIKKGKRELPQAGGIALLPGETAPKGVPVSKQFTVEEIKRGIGVGGRPSGNGGVSDAERRRQAEAKRIAEVKRLAEVKRIAEEKAKQQQLLKELQQRREARALQLEQNRINALRQKLIREGARRRVQTFIDKDTRDRVRHETLINLRTGERIFKTINLRTRKIITRTFQRPSGGGFVRRTGGLIEKKGEVAIQKKELVPKLPKPLERRKRETLIERFKREVKELKTLSKEERSLRQKEKLEKINLAFSYQRNKPFRTLIKEGDIPSAVIRAFDWGGEKLLTISDMALAKVTGRERLSKQDIKFGGRILGEFGLFAGFSPIMTSTGEVLAKLPSRTSVQFIGKQRFKDGKVLTNVVFKSSGRRIGVATGVSIIKGKNAITISRGISGRKGIKFPTGKIGLFEKKAFAGIEKSVIKPMVFKIKREITNIGTIKQNIKGLIQFGGGRILQIKGSKIIQTGIEFPTGRLITRFPFKRTLLRKRKLRKSYDLDDFASIAGVLTKKDVSLIAGNVLTKTGDIVKFTGIILGKGRIGEKTFRLTNPQKLLYNHALQNVLSIASSSLKASKIKGLSSGAKAIIFSGALKVQPIKTTLAIPKQIPSQIITSRITQTQITKIPITRVRQETKIRTKQLESQISKIKQKVRQIEKVKLKTKQKTRQKLRAIQKIKQLQKQRQKLITRFKLKLKTDTKLKPKLALKIPTIKLITKRLLIPLKISKGFTKRKLTKAQPVFFVKMKRRGKIINLHQRPLTLTDAKDFLAYRIDHGLSRSAWFEPLGKAKNVVGLPPGMKGYFRKVSHKLRPFKIRAGKKKEIRMGYIEKRKFSLDTFGEKRALQRARSRKKVKRRPTTRRKIRRR